MSLDREQSHALQYQGQFFQFGLDDKELQIQLRPNQELRNRIAQVCS